MSKRDKIAMLNGKVVYYTTGKYLPCSIRFFMTQILEIRLIINEVVYNSKFTGEV